MPTKQKVHLPFKDLHKKSGYIDTSTMDHPRLKTAGGGEQSIFRGKNALRCIDVFGNIGRYTPGSAFNDSFNAMVLSSDPQFLNHVLTDAAFGSIFKCDAIFALFRNGIFYLSMCKNYKDTLAEVKKLGTWESIIMIYNLKNLTPETKASIADQWKCKLLNLMGNKEKPLNRIRGNNALMSVLADALPGEENTYQLISDGLPVSPMKRKGTKVANKKNDGTTDNEGRAKKKTKEVRAEASPSEQESVKKKSSNKKASKKDKVSSFYCLSMCDLSPITYVQTLLIVFFTVEG